MSDLRGVVNRFKMDQTEMASNFSADLRKDVRNSIIQAPHRGCRKLLGDLGKDLTGVDEGDHAFAVLIANHGFSGDFEVVGSLDFV